MKIVNYWRKAITNPGISYRVVRRLLPRIATIWRTRGLIPAIGYPLYYFSHYTGLPIDAIYWKLLMKYYGQNLVKTKVLDFELFVDLDDRGISRQLWLEGVREHGAVAAYKRELLRLKDRVGQNITIIDVGANIGYYVTIAARVLQKSRIFAIEPAPTNVELLTKNVRLNGLEDRVDIIQAACSNFTGKSPLYLSTQSNVHSMEMVSHKWIEVPTWRLDDLVGYKGITPEDINVVRMDTEGHELEIIEGMEGILGYGGPLLLFIEFDARLLKGGKLKKLIEILNNAGFKIAYACNDYFTGTVEEFSSFRDLPDNLRRHNAAEVFLTRGY